MSRNMPIGASQRWWYRHKYRALTVLTGFGIGLAACSAPSPVQSADGPGPCAADLTHSAETVVIAPTATSAEPAPTLPAGLRAELESTAATRKESCVAIAMPDGDSLEAFNVTAVRPNGQVENGPGRDALTAANLDAISVRLSQVERTAEGMNPLLVLDAAVRLHPTPGTVYVITSGISTEDPVDLRVLGWDLDAQQQAGAMARDGNAVDLTGWHVHFVGLGDAAGKQPKPSLALRGRLVDWWMAICQAGGAAECTSDKELLHQMVPVSSNTVPVIDLPKPRITANTVVLPNALTFAIRSYIVQPAAGDSLAAVIERVLRTGETVNVTGHTDAITGTVAGNLRLSQQRADAVVDQLVRLGLPQLQIGDVTGVGSRDASANTERGDPGQVGKDRNVQITFAHP